LRRPDRESAFANRWAAVHLLLLACLISGCSSTSVDPTNPTEPEEVVRGFYGLITYHEYSRAWDLLSPRYQASRDYETWSAGFATTRAIRPDPTGGSRGHFAIKTISKTQRSARVAFTITVVPLDDKEPTRDFAGTWQLVQIDGNWRLDSEDSRQTR
jgi:hypothetical protein